MKIEVYPSARNKNRSHKDSVFAYIMGEQGKNFQKKRYSTLTFDLIAKHVSS
jgi:hypothetical protein